MPLRALLARTRRVMPMAAVLLAISVAVHAAWQPPPVTLSIVGTTDLHGYVFPRDGRGGVELLGGYMANLRAARHDGGAVVLVDSGDTFQGGIESNLSEGALVVDAYNALGYAAAAIGNHEFEFGAVDSWEERPPAFSDLRGALKARAMQARFPLLAANLHDLDPIHPVAWPNVRPSTIVDAAGVKVGIVGVMTKDALAMTLAANVGGLSVSPLLPAIAQEATHLRRQGAAVVVVASHAGGSCSAFGTPTDLSSCDERAEIFEVARRLPRGLVDVIVAGHTHANVAHEVNGIAIVQAGSWGRAFSRVDVAFDRATSTVTGTRIFEPHEICARDAVGTTGCAAAGSLASTQARYEGRSVLPDPVVTAAMAPALTRVRELRSTPLGVSLQSAALRGEGTDESPLANMFAEALRAAVPGVDAAVTFGSGPGGMRTDLPAGPLTLGDLYDVFPFDNRVIRLRLSGADLKRVIATQTERSFARGRAMGVSGLRIRVGCGSGRAVVDVARDDGTPVGDADAVALATMDFMVGRGPFPVPLAGAPDGSGETPLVRDAAWRWFRNKGTLDPAAFHDSAKPRWARAPGATCLD